MYIVLLQKIFIPPSHCKEFFLRTPAPLEIPIKLHTFLYLFWSYRTLHPPCQNISMPLVVVMGEYGYFLHNAYSGLSLSFESPVALFSMPVANLLLCG